MPEPQKGEGKSQFISRCIPVLIDEGKAQDQATAICHSMWESHMSGSQDGMQFSTITPEEAQELLGAVPVEEGEILQFRNAVVARAEVNRNNDGLDRTGIDELVATLPAKPLNDEHNKRAICGYFTAARNVEDALVADGVIWMGNYPDVAEGVQTGEKKLSIEAAAKRAKCGECGASFVSAAQYCEHLRSKKAVRWLYGLRARGAATTVKPAGSGTEFNAAGLMLVAHEEEDAPARSREKAKEMENELQAKIDELNEEVKAKTSEIQAKEVELQASQESLEQANTRVSELEASVQEKDGEVEALKEQVVETERVQKLSAQRAAQLMASHSQEEIDAVWGELGTMSEAAFALMAKAQPVIQVTAATTSNGVPQDDNVSDNNKVEISWGK